MLTVIVILVLVVAGGYIIYKRRNSFKSEEDLVKEVLSSIKLTQEDLPPYIHEDVKPVEEPVKEEPVVIQPVVEEPQEEAPVVEPVVEKTATPEPTALPTKPTRKYYRRKNKPKK